MIRGVIHIITNVRGRMANMICYLMDVMERKAVKVKIKILETGNNKIIHMKKIAAIFFMLFFIGPSTLPAGITHTVLPANTAASGSAAVQNAAGIQKSVAQVTSNSQPQAVVPPAQNVLPPQKASSNQPELPVKVPAALQKNPLPSNPVVPPNPPKIDTKPGAVSGEPGKSAEASTSSGPQSVRSTIPPRPRFLSQGHVSLNFDDADIYSVIQTVFGEILRVNYIIDARVKGRVTFRSVSPVAREKVLPLMEVILKLNGAAIVEDGELYRIVPSELKDKKGIRVFIYHVQNAKAKDITSMLQQLFLGGRSHTTDGSAKSTSESTSLSAASSAQFSKAVVAGNRQSGVEGILSDEVKIFADEKLNSVVILGTREDYEIIKQTITELDIIPRQVLIEGTIASIQLTDKMSLGLAWSLKTNFSAFGLDKLHISFNPTSLQVDPTAPTTDGLNIIGVDSSATVRAVINALASDSKAKLMAAPHIMVSDNNEARIQVGQQVPIVTSETYTTTTTVPTRTIQYKDIGIILKVKPQINDSGLINLQIAQEVSTYRTIKLYANEDQIILDKTEATTNLVVKNGQTIVIGGLIREDDSKAREGIPWLSKIPILGYLFGNTTKENNRTELVILLTPYIVKDQQDVAAVTNKYADQITDKYISKELKQNIHQEKNEQEEKAEKK